MSPLLQLIPLLLALIHDTLRSLPLPKPLQATLTTLRAPFQPFLSLSDLSEFQPNSEDETRKTAAIWKARVMVCLSTLESISWFAYFVYALAIRDKAGTAHGILAFLTWGYAAARTALRPPQTPPYLLILFALVHAIAGADDLIHHAHASPAQLVLDCARISLPAIVIWIAGTLPLERVLPTHNVAQPHQIPSNALSNPEDAATLWTWSTFSFVSPIFSLAHSKRLDEEDVWRLSPYFRHANLFKKAQAYRAAHPTHSLLRFLLASNSLDLIIDIALELWSAVIGFVPPYALQQILSALAAPSPSARTTAYTWSAITLLAHLSFAQKDLLQMWHTRRCYERTRGQLFCALHWKALVRRDLSGKVAPGDAEGGADVKGGADLGKIVNLMQGDAYAVSQRFWEFSAIFASPIRLVIALVFLYQVLGWSALSGVVVVLVAYALNYPLAKYNIYITRQSWRAKDGRMNVVNELLQNVRFLKFYGWENHWARKAHSARESELAWRVKENTVDTLISFIWTWIPSATALTSFLCYTLIAGEKLTVSKAFTSIALFSQLQGPMTALPGQFFAMLHAYVSMQRIEEYLSEEEVPDWASSLKSHASPTSSGDDVGFKAASFEWHGVPNTALGPARFELGPLDVRFPKGKLTLVSGATGSGKSALLAALLGEMHCLSGSVHLDKSVHQVAYCAQNPWLEHATIKDNIIFGSTRGYEEERYNAVVEACALSRDLEIFEARDMTEIGEKGITLSGGQRARIALARALYSQASCILLDDPLAAVDMHTAQHIVTHCLSGALARDRTVILVTHHIALCLPAASYLVELSRGQILRVGSIQEFEDLGELQQVVDAEDDVASEPELTSTETIENEADFEETPKKMQAGDRARKGKLIEAEARAEGRVSLRTYWTYIRAAGIVSWFLTVCLMLLIRLINIGNQVFLAKWGEAYNEAGYSPSVFLPLAVANYPWGLPSPDVNVRPWLMIYLYISLAGAFSVLAYIALGYYASLQASRSLFVSLLNRLTRAPVRFFDVTPIGRILNRFTTDINTVDAALQNSARAALSGILNFLASFLVIISVVPTFAPFALFIAWLYIRLAPPYIRASRDLRRLESVSLSPAFAGFDELLRGLAHVRAFAMEARYQDGFYRKVDTFQTFDHWLVSAWLRWRYDCLGSVVVFLTTVFALWKGVSDGWAALVIVQAGIFAEASRQLVKVAAQLELDFNSVERIVEYLDVPQEAPAILEKSRPPAYWPSSTGGLAVEGLVVQYAPDLPVVLQNLSFVVRPSEKIGVVGRTGSGKSTLALSLLRMVEPTTGRITIDGVDISTIGLEDLRTRITIVSQDVSLFSGTIRSNLDPFGEHTDQECWDVLDRCHLTSLLSRAPDRCVSLDMPMSQGGSLSAGERQLVALARAVLRRTNIVVMDEATSQIDSRLDDQIQKTIREELSDALVITIAHRLKTVIDYDRILVLDVGYIVEFDEPRVLLMKPGGVFREMCRRSTDWPLLAAAMERNRQ